ncbi:hypothetical protein SAICODRAFT_92959 [Saitoella complicata NRRL Y-17804]|nr:uncharacterized protein SAICODRAFT_92959 [Saitoella complicata NRRL Y-17804]ODQ52681.1 hypothetical protein SAICODRAFT_92959 [Saitoella complicata NRRL Y-17804]
MRPTVVIDNYDSFTWNVVEYLDAVGAVDLQVYRNDKITLEELVALNPSKLVVSPGPGHPETDGGISRGAIEYFAGKIPILGVCMGEQCIFSVFGGKVEFAGEIVHGKTSTITHDGKGIYRNVPQDIAVTRYHSLAGTHATLPPSLEVTSRTESGVIMGVRHKKYTVEGVQYHPESILSEEGKRIFRNFLDLDCGTWAEAERLQKPDASVSSAAPAKKSGSILDKIHEQRLVDIAQAKSTPGFRREDLETLVRLNVCPPLIDFPARLRQTLPEYPALMAEVKRASPSKGDIDISANAAAQALLYARAGASTISVLTEPHWFKGSLSDLRAARDAIGTLPNRPALLRKDFIIDTYQILEARVAGADTVLLIVAMLSDAELKELYDFAKSLGMEPLVEVNNAEEMKRALAIGSKVIGVNNRNLHSFAVDLGTTSNLATMVPEGTTLCALSGITGPEDVKKYVSEGVGAVLVGEALMRSTDKGEFIAYLLGYAEERTKVAKTEPLVKICGTRTSEAAVVAAEAGADLIGMIFVKGSKRCISVETGVEIATAVRARAGEVKESKVSADVRTGKIPAANDWFSYHLNAIRSAPRRPLFVGVFQNQPLDYVLDVTKTVGLDLVQLHGQEAIEWAHLISVPVVRAFRPEDRDMSRRGYHAVTLLDATSSNGQAGGLGIKLDWGAVKKVVQDGNDVLLAGGLEPENVREALEKTGAAGVDVSSGVETGGKQDLEKIKKFVQEAKSVKA